MPSFSSYPEDLYRITVPKDEVYGNIDVTDRDTSLWVYYMFSPCTQVTDRLLSCWCFWTLKASMKQLGTATSITVRAMDESLAIQPRDLYTKYVSFLFLYPCPALIGMPRSAEGLMTNWWYRVAIHREVLEATADSEESNVLRFEHPVHINASGETVGGWIDVRSHTVSSVCCDPSDAALSYSG